MLYLVPLTTFHSMKKILFLNMLLVSLIFASMGLMSGVSDIESPLYSASQIQRQVARDTTPQKTMMRADAVVEHASPAVVSVGIYEDVSIFSFGSLHGSPASSFSRMLDGLTTYVNTRKAKVGSGSAFFITSDGYLLTNRHVVEDTDAQYIVTISPVSHKEAHVVYRDPDMDIAILKIDGTDYPVITLGNSSDLEIGESIVGIGNALGKLTDSVSQGEVSALNLSITVEDRGSFERMKGMIQTSAKLYPGDSGGPLLDFQGEAVGVNAAAATHENLSFSIPINAVREILKKAGVHVS